ncbi:Conserved membrane protein [Lactobacillus gigeriorum DSM 23908 = CRBIP 24.85]|uniref:Membrane protein n=1 Tax=Lactobacillus gigeriorum DSM 23908 = CRBIP 24.85 TaxID=1423751 RepID=I7K1Z2_9LACO|nr:membrane protein [Lactobacillus gigeriorum DSM 23908 = CRBIP 24.85]CCI87735.1 Conserved membrane protein [Lactobacillus gigeriorum DSM 23908 = CRBIP 24.85]
MEYLKLLGILLIIVGFVFKWDSAAVVVFSAIATGLLSGMDLMQLLTTIGTSFVNNRAVTVFILTLPMIGLIESHGLKEVAVNAISKLKKLTPSRILNIYLAIRELGGLFGISLQGQVQFVRPLISPMVSAAVELEKGEN